MRVFICILVCVGHVLEFQASLTKMEISSKNDINYVTFIAFSV